MTFSALMLNVAIATICISLVRPRCVQALPSGRLVGSEERWVSPRMPSAIDVLASDLRAECLSSRLGVLALHASRRGSDISACNINRIAPVQSLRAVEKKYTFL